MARLVLLVAAVVCFAIAVLIAVAAFSGGNFDAWLAGGLLAWALAALVPAVVPHVVTTPPAPPQ